MTDLFAPLPDGKFDIIYADPPWKHNQQIRDSNGALTRAADHYPTVPTKQIARLPVPGVIAPNALLFLWATGSMLDDAMFVLEQWGFEYATVGFVWRKIGFPVCGHYSMSECEFVLLGRHGKIPQPRGARNVRQFIECKRGAHSAKPVEVQQRIDDMFPSQRKLELFARQNRSPSLLRPASGWTYWGNEA